MVNVENDVQNVVNDIAAIDRHLRVRWSEAGEYFVVWYQPEDEVDGNGYLVTTAQELDQRLVTHVRKLHQRALDPGWSYAKELEAVEERRRKEADQAFTEHNGEMYERLAHAMRKDAGYDQRRVFVPEGVGSGQPGHQDD